MPRHPRTKLAVLIAIVSIPWQMASGQSPADGVRAARAFRTSHSIAILDEFRELLALPNESREQEDVRAVAEHVRTMLGERGVDTEFLESDGANPVIYGELLSPQAERTIVIYIHYDGQPVNPSRWNTTRPFQPAYYSKAWEEGGTPREWPADGESIDSQHRIYARSSSDDKLPIIALTAALDALKAAELTPTSNIKLFLDGEEEIGSPNMRQFLARYADLFEDADLWLFLDGPLHQSRQPTLYFGVRGYSSLDITVYGASRNLHSGHYGNWAPNPALRLSRLLTSMKDDSEQALVPGFYDSVEPLTEIERDALTRIPPVDRQLKHELGLADDRDGESYQESLQRPSLNIRGLASATVGPSARNIVPNEATASIDIRLVKGNDPNEMLDLVEAHIRDQGYHIVREDPDLATRRKHRLIAKVTRRPGYPAARTQMDDPKIQPVIEAMRITVGDRPLLLIPTIGGSLPLYLVTDVLDKPLIIVPFANHDNNQHAPDENIRIGNLMDAIDHLAGLLMMAPE